MIPRPALSPARAALRRAVTHPSGGLEIACADNTAELFLAYALTAGLERPSGLERLQTLAAVKLALDVLTVELGAEGFEVDLASLTPSPWAAGIFAVLKDPRFAAELQQCFGRGVTTQIAALRDSQLLAVTPGGVA
jgi:hypothetical protein